MPEEQQRRQLEKMHNGRPPFSYGPLRSCFHDIFNIQPEMFAPATATDWSKVEAQLRRKCRTDDELRSNLAVARGLHRFATEANMLGRAQDFFPLAMGAGQKVSYWLPMVLSHGGTPLVPFIDPRRSLALTRDGRRFAFSMMHERTRAADPDYEGVSLAIFQFGDVDGDQRKPVLHTDDGVTLYSLDQLDAMITFTYSLWREVCEEREVEARRKGTGTSGPLI
jgi:hypothetical protein